MTTSFFSRTITFPDGRPAHSFLSVVDVASLFGISEAVVYDAIKAGELYRKPFSKRRYVVALEDALAWFNADR